MSDKFHELEAEDKFTDFSPKQIEMLKIKSCLRLLAASNRIFLRSLLFFLQTNTQIMCNIVCECFFLCLYVCVLAIRSLTRGPSTYCRRKFGFIVAEILQRQL